MGKRRDAGSGGIEKTPAGTYKVVIDIGRDPDSGKRRRFRKTFKTLREAQRAARDVLTKRDGGLAVEPEKVTTGEWVSQWLDRHAREGHISGATHERYSVAVRVHIEPLVGSIPLQRLRREHVLDLRAALVAGEGGRRPQSPASVKKTLGVLRQALEEAARNGVLAVNPAAHVQAPPLSTNEEQRALTEHELVKLLGAARGSRFDVPIRLTLATGLRRGELLALRWEDIDLEGRRLNVRQTASLAGGQVEFREPKSKSRRSIGLSTSTASVLRQHRISQTERRLSLALGWSEPELVFPSMTGTVWQFRNFLRDFRRVLAKTDIERPQSVTWHSLRHTAASQWIASGASVFEVSRRLGHSSTSTTERVYAHLLPRQDDVSAHALDHLIAT